MDGKKDNRQPHEDDKRGILTRCYFRRVGGFRAKIINFRLCLLYGTGSDNRYFIPILPPCPTFFAIAKVYHKMIATINGNSLSIPLHDSIVQCVITSPPYYGLRDYGVFGQIGLEPTPQAYISNIVAVMRECWRVMRPDATLWLVIGDSYAGNGGEPGRENRELLHMEGKQKRMCAIPDGSNLKPKDLCGIPWRIAFALQDNGWTLRSDIIWSKSNPMPESVTDRPTRAHEYIFLLAKQEKYYYDAEAIAEKAISARGGCKTSFRGNGSNRPERDFTQIGTSGQRNRRSVWTIATENYSGSHFATFPTKLVEPMILAGSRPDDIVLDPFAGTSTVGRVCAKHGRRFVGVELNPAYIELAKDRTSRVQIALDV